MIPVAPESFLERLETSDIPEDLQLCVLCVGFMAATSQVTAELQQLSVAIATAHFCVLDEIIEDDDFDVGYRRPSWCAPKRV